MTDKTLKQIGFGDHVAERGQVIRGEMFVISIWPETGLIGMNSGKDLNELLAHFYYFAFISILSLYLFSSIKLPLYFLVL